MCAALGRKVLRTHVVDKAAPSARPSDRKPRLTQNRRGGAGLSPVRAHQARRWFQVALRNTLEWRRFIEGAGACVGSVSASSPCGRQNGVKARDEAVIRLNRALRYRFNQRAHALRMAAMTTLLWPESACPW